MELCQSEGRRQSVAAPRAAVVGPAGSAPSSAWYGAYTRPVTYVALLRGINVGGRNPVDMKRLQAVFEETGMTSVKTYINSGNVIFASRMRSLQRLAARLEAAIEAAFGFEIKVVVRDRRMMTAIVEALPEDWKDDASTKCDVMFLWDEVDAPSVLDALSFDPDREAVRYVPGAVLWCVDRSYLTRSRMLKVAGTALYKRMTVRNCNTVRKLLELME
jgi:uncharacterized protein (DUF1697 family)